MNSPFALVPPLLLSIAWTSSAGVFVPVDFGSSHNYRLQDNAGAAANYPEGSVELGGVPFEIPVGGNNTWNAEIAGGANPRTLSIPVGRYGVDTVHTLVNTWWGEKTQGSFASIRFLGSGGLDYTVHLDGNDDIRDFLLNNLTDQINGTTTREVFTAGSGIRNLVRLDMQEFDLPEAFLGATLDTIQLVDTGGFAFQRVFLGGVTLTVVPEVRDWNNVGAAGLLGLAGLRIACRWRRTSRTSQPPGA